MNTMIECTGQAFSDFVIGLKSDLFEVGFSGRQVKGIEDLLLTRITVLMQVYTDTPEKSLTVIAKALTEDSILTPYTYDTDTGMLERHNPLKISQEYKRGIKASINLNPYLAQYERI